MKNAVIGTQDYHTTMQNAAKHALQKAGGYVAHNTGDTRYLDYYPTLDMKLQHLHHMVCGIQFQGNSQTMIAANPRITYLLLIESLLTVKSDDFEMPLRHARMRLIALLVEICVMGQADNAALADVAGYLVQLSSQTPAIGRIFSNYSSESKSNHFIQYCLSIAETLYSATREDYDLIQYRVSFLKYWRDLSAQLIFNRNWRDIDVSMNWLRQQVISKLESDMP
jgi:hypothetical protein